MRTCIDCGKKLGFFERGPRCKICKSNYEAEQERIRQIEQEERERAENERKIKLNDIEYRITKNFDFNEEDVKFLKSCDKETAIKLYDRLLINFENDRELSEKELTILNKLQETCNLSNADVRFDERVKPYVYAYFIREKKALPTVHLSYHGISPVILKKDEIVHFADNDGTVLKEPKIVTLGYRGGSHGVSFPIPGLKGVRYRVGSHRGHIMKEEQLVTTSSGFLIVTNQRIFLHPFPGNKPLSIPLAKILSYHAYNNGLEVYKEGREKGYFFMMQNSGSVELVGMCLSFLLAKVE